ncbi:TerD family protein, partial [Frankia nepalensis]|uniref:TerD family protein n=1 Tax=Frankia nepalensis TaxID=1836974 RepID=UPI001933F6A0
MLELVAGANASLPLGAVRIRLPGPFDLSALVVGANGRVGGDGDFVFYNQPTAAGVRLASAGPGGAAAPGTSELTVDPRRLRPGAARVVLVASPADGSTAFGRLPAPVTTVHDLAGAALVRLRPPRLGPETALLVGELYRRDPPGGGPAGAGGWRVRAIGQGYADGLAGLARDFGVDVEPPPVPVARPRPVPVVPPDRRPPRAPVPTPARAGRASPVSYTHLRGPQPHMHRV